MEKKRKVVVLYTVIFIGLCLVVFYPFYRNGKSFVWGTIATDGFDQHLKSVAYFGQYIRNFITNLFHGHFKLQMWDLSIGYGSDILTTLNYYAIGDPLNLLYGFATKHTIVYFYNGMTLLRMYLAGLSFLMFMFYQKKHEIGSLVGALVYVFSGFALSYGMHHPFFLNPMIYLPLLLLAVDRVYREDKAGLFCMMVIVSAISNFYFFYMLTIAVFLYGFLQYFYYNDKTHRNWKLFLQTFGKFAMFFIVAIGISAILFLPILIAFSNNARIDGGSSYNLIYNLAYYGKTFMNLFGYQQDLNGSGLNLLPIAFVSILTIFTAKKKEAFTFKVLSAFFFVALCVPVLAYALHGFTYPSNRWSFILIFMVGVLVGEAYPLLFKLRKSQMICSVICSIIYTIVLFAGKHVLEGRPMPQQVGVETTAILVIGTTLFVLFLNTSHMRNHKKIAQVLLIGVVCFNVCVSAYYHFSTRVSRELKQYMSQEAATQKIDNQRATYLKQKKDTNLYRSELLGGRYNEGFLQGLPSTNNYFSVTDKNVANAIKDYEVSRYRYLFKFKKLDERKALQALHCVKYIEKRDKNKKSIFEENQDVLPFGYTYDAYITEDNYKNLNSIEKEQTMLNAAVLAEPVKGLKEETKSDAVTSKKIDLPKQTYHVKRKSKSPQVIEFDVTPEKGMSNYFRIGFFDYKQYADLDQSLKYRFLKNNNKFRVFIDDQRNVMLFQQKGSSYYFNRHGYTYKISDDKATKKVKLQVKQPGTYQIKNIESIYVDPKKEKNNIRKRQQSESLKQISYDGGDYLSGEIDLKKQKVLCIPIPYSKGWTMYDNGEKVDIKMVNCMYIGSVLEKGHHKIELKYVTPGLKPGAGISLIFLVIAGIIYYTRKKIKCKSRT